MNELLEKIKERIEPVLDKLNVYLIDLTASKVKNANKYIFYIDKDTYVTVDDCSIVSRELEKILVDEKLISQNDQIEVSSPGVDRPLKFLRQYPKHKEKYFSVTFRKDDNIITKELVLKDVIDEKLIFDDRGNSIEINFSDIIKAKTLIKFK
ncbi:MAG: ribosome maturation factor RimP [Ignavibacteria bacterium]